MSTSEEKLSQDLEILEAMAGEMSEYLMSEVLFWPMAKGHLPRLTIGGYLMRQDRLMALRQLLTEADQSRLQAAVRQFNEALVEKVVRFEQRAHRELRARLRQWAEYLKDLSKEFRPSVDHYASAVETRVMISSLLDKLQAPPYELEEGILQQVAVYDANLRKRWHPGDFILPAKWQPAYPRSKYWWLYGHPR